MAIFDSLKNNMFDITTKVMGYNAVWVNSQTLEENGAVVHFKNPTEKEVLESINYIEGQPVMEYRAPFFEGLKEASDNLLDEQITISGKGLFWVRQVVKNYDGDTFLAILAPAE